MFTVRHTSGRYPEAPTARERSMQSMTSTGHPPTIATAMTEEASTRPWRAWLVPIGVLAVLIASLLVLRHELAATGYHRIALALEAIPDSHLLQATLLTVVAYGLLTGYDLLALRYVGAKLGVARTALASLLAYALSQTLGFPLISGGAVRVRFWSAWGLGTPEIAQATAFVGATFSVGVAAVSGLAFLLEPAETLRSLHIPVWTARAGGVLLSTVVIAYLGIAVLRKGRGWTWRDYQVPVPSVALASSQVLLALCDWAVAGVVLYVLLPPSSTMPLLTFLGVFSLAQLAGVISHVPGGVGVFETLMILALRGAGSPEELVGALVAYRAIYYLLPFVLAVVTMVGIELHTRRAQVPALVRATGRAAASVRNRMLFVGGSLQPLLPTVIGVSTFIGGTLLLFSGATPAAHGRVRVLTAVLPLGLVELSHFAASMAGVGLLVLGAALRRRLDAAWGVAVVVLSIGIAASLLKGLDWEEASVLAVVLTLLVLAKPAFYRRSALHWDILTPGWLVAMIGVVGASVWLGLFAYRHVGYSTELWWEVAIRGNAPRFLRASAGAVAVVLLIALRRLLGPASVTPALPTADDLAQALTIVHSVPESTPALALLGDKALLFGESRDAFVMYGVAGRSWVSMGDPVGSDSAAAEVAWRFMEEADACGAWPVFYQVTPERLPLYVDLGLSLFKLGEEAVVPLANFNLDGAERRWMRRALKETAKFGLEFSIIPAVEVPAMMPTLRAISDEWLGDKRTREKGFSLGRFDERYLACFPHAIVTAPVNGERIPVAFANLWIGAAGGDVSPDLMRRSHAAPRGTMDFLFIQMLLWAQAHGYRACNLGMAPMAGLVDPSLSKRELAPAWARAGSLLYGHGESFYNFQGLRNFKEKFSPEWEPRYLASPGGIALPQVLANLASIISGGIGGMVRK